MNAQVAEMVDEGVRAARQAVTESRRAIEDARERAEWRIRRAPWPALGVVALVAFGLGSLIGALAVSACRPKPVWRR